VTTSTVKSTPLDDLITEKLAPYVSASEAVRDSERELRSLSQSRNGLAVELQNLLVARSVLRDGKAFTGADANFELSNLERGVTA
jgi:hypothetical protein